MLTTAGTRTGCAIMEAMPNESHATSAYDDHEARLSNVENAVTDLHCDMALLKQRVDSGFEAVQAQFALTEEKLRGEFRDGLHTLEQSLSIKIDVESKRLGDRLSGEIQTLIVRMDRQDARLERRDARMDQLDTKIDQLAKWMIGTQLTTMAFVVAIAAQLFLH